MGKPAAKKTAAAKPKATDDREVVSVESDPIDATKVAQIEAARGALAGDLRMKMFEAGTVPSDWEDVTVELTKPGKDGTVTIKAEARRRPDRPTK
jgi:hypothetical protein